MEACTEGQDSLGYKNTMLPSKGHTSCRSTGLFCSPCCFSANVEAQMKLSCMLIFELPAAGMGKVRRTAFACLPNDEIMEDNPNSLFLINVGALNVCPKCLSHFLPNWEVYQTHMLQECNHFSIAHPKSKRLIYFTAKPVGLEITVKKKKKDWLSESPFFPNILEHK